MTPDDFELTHFILTKKCPSSARYMGMHASTPFQTRLVWPTPVLPLTGLFLGRSRNVATGERKMTIYRRHRVML